MIASKSDTRHLTNLEQIKKQQQQKDLGARPSKKSLKAIKWKVEQARGRRSDAIAIRVSDAREETTLTLGLSINSSSV